MARRRWTIAALLVRLAGCGQKQPEQGIVIRFAHATTGGATKPVLDWACEEFAKHNPGGEGGAGHAIG